MIFQAKVQQEKYGGEFCYDKTLSKEWLLDLEGKLQQATLPSTFGT